MKKFILGFLVGVSITAAGSVYADEGLQKIEAYLRPSLPVTMNGTAVKLYNPPVMVDGSTYLKLRDVAAVTGITVNWNETTQTVELNNKGVNDVPQTTTEPTQINDDLVNKIDDLKRKIRIAQANIDIFNSEIKGNPSLKSQYQATIDELTSKISLYEEQLTELQK
ncbi:stalk domain-containing protein [Paenibacillus qinlingensis]|uniref:Copper amine oxidase-like N-terminal domain-containing protein n=1 Tax=Paenibacillus qinlingensis TaxID=1837343 RepID=A0ABU1P6W8_9BACL|nr:stalk domain-containing protein [Paenibacillus qinlingensis]MDR6555428.1 hypothetical protein [Paenibacillus qinlingensis]